MRIFFKLALLGVLFCSCGVRTNLLERYAPLNGLERAQRDLEAGDYATAQVRLEAELNRDPEQPEVRALLAACHAAQGGVTVLGFMTKLLGGMAQGGGGGSPASLMSEALPAPTAQRVADLGKAVTVASAIDDASLTSDMRYEFGLFGTAYVFLSLNYFASDAAVRAALNDADAAAWFAALAKTKAWMQGSDNPAATVLSALVAGVEALPGTELEKLTVLAATAFL